MTEIVGATSQQADLLHQIRSIVNEYRSGARWSSQGMERIAALLDEPAVTMTTDRASELPEVLIDAWVEWCSVHIYDGGSGPADLDAFLADMRTTVQKFQGWDQHK